MAHRESAPVRDRLRRRRGPRRRAHDQIVRNALTDEIGKRNLADVLAGGKRTEVRAVRADLARDARDSASRSSMCASSASTSSTRSTTAVYERMKADRMRVANELRATGEAEAEKIRADAERQRSTILAEAQRDAETIKGRGRCEGVADLCPVVRQESGILPVLSVDGSL